MAGFISWFQANWATFFGTIGAIIGACFTVAAFRQTAEKADRDEYSTLVEQHHALWAEARERGDLNRILLEDIDLQQVPPTPVEQMFLNDVFVHFESGWKLALKNTVLTMNTFTADVRRFFTLPLPRAVWEQTKAARNPQFVSFIAKTIDEKRVRFS